MNQPPKPKRARAVIEVDAVPIHARWMPVEAAVNSVLVKFGIKTKITLRQETPFLIVEGSRRPTLKRSIREIGSIGVHVIKAQP